MLHQSLEEQFDMNLPTVLETCVPREDVLSGTIADANFAADLAKVIRGTASDDVNSFSSSSR
jgi:hypothetical protein